MNKKDEKLVKERKVPVSDIVLPKSVPTSPLTIRFKSLFKKNITMELPTLEKCCSEPNVFQDISTSQSDRKDNKKSSKSHEYLDFNQEDEDTRLKASSEEVLAKALRYRLGHKESGDEADSANGEMIPEHPPQARESSGDRGTHTGQTDNNGGLIAPRKLQNPCLESQDRQSLHRELMFNQKIGKNVLNQKSELQKAMQKHREKQILQHEKEKASEQTPEFCRAIAERAKRLDCPIQVQSRPEGLSSEYLNARAKLRATIDTK